MKKHTTIGLGQLIYMEWLVPIKDYYCSIKKNEAVFEIIVPLLISLGCSFLYWRAGKVFQALDGLSDLLPTAISVLIGFTVMLITLLLTSSGKNIDLLKTIKTDKTLYNKPVTLFQLLHIQFSHSLFSEILLLLLTFFCLFWQGLAMPIFAGIVILLLEVYLTLTILFSLLRGITNLYFSFYKQIDKNDSH